MSNLLFIGMAILIGGITFVTIRFDELRASSSVWPQGKKERLYIGMMLVGTVVLSYVLFQVYAEQSILFYTKRLLIVSILWAAAFYDYKSYKIPNRLILLGLSYRLIIFVLECLFERKQIVAILASEVVALIAMVVLSVLCLVLMKGSLGMGDVKLFLVMALMLGMNGITSAIFLSLMTAFFASIYLLVTKKKSRKDVIPFAPFILIGTYLSVILTGM